MVLKMGMDMVTYLRTEWISAALCTNQTPRDAEVCLQLGTEDGRAVTFIPRSVKTLLTSTADKDGKVSVSARRQLKQNEENRKAAQVKIIDQYADALTEVDDETVDVVVSLNCAQRLKENGRSWKKSVQEAARVLKPGGRFLWVEQTELNGESYLSYIENLCVQRLPSTDNADAVESGTEEEEDNTYPVFTDIGWDDVGMVLVPHIAGLAVKATDPTQLAQLAQREEQNRMADLSMAAFERGLKKRKKRRKKKKKAPAPAVDDFGGFDDAGFGGFDEGAPAAPPEAMDGFGDDFEDDGSAASAVESSAAPMAGGGGGDGGEEEFDEWDGFGEEEEDVYKAAASGQNIQSTNFVYSDANEMIVQAKIDFTAVESEDLSFKKGDELTAKDIGDADWWLGKDKAGKEGMVQRTDFLVIDDGS